MDETEIIVEVLKDEEQRAIKVGLNCFELISIIGHIELALKHPLNKGPASIIAKTIALKLIDELIENWPIIYEQSELIKAWEEAFEIKITL